MRGGDSFCIKLSVSASNNCAVFSQRMRRRHGPLQRRHPPPGHQGLRQPRLCAESWRQQRQGHRHQPQAEGQPHPQVSWTLYVRQSSSGFLSHCETSFKAKKSENAVDIYFLLDISASMKPIQDRLVQVPNKLIEVSEAVKSYFVSFVIKQNIRQKYLTSIL